jgi:hypothetical protein
VMEYVSLDFRWVRHCLRRRGRVDADGVEGVRFGVSRVGAYLGIGSRDDVNAVISP